MPDAITYQTYTKFLTIKRHSGDMRLTAGVPDLSPGETTYQIKVVVPTMRQPIPAGVIELRLPEYPVGQVSMVVTDQPVEDGEPRKHVFEACDLNAAACRHCAMLLTSPLHKCQQPDCHRLARHDVRGVPYCEYDTPVPVTMTEITDEEGESA